MVYPIAERVRRALAATRCVPNLCLNRVRTWSGVPARYPSAKVAWQHAEHKHGPADHHPPAGVPVWFDKPGGSRFGHIVLSLGDGKYRSTDQPRSSYVGTVTAEDLRRRWGMVPLGWAETLNGVRVWSPPPAGQHPAQAPGVHLRNLRAGKQHADVEQLVRALNRKLGGADLPVGRTYSTAVDSAVRREQRLAGDPVDPAGKSYVGPRQAKRLGLRVLP